MWILKVTAACDGVSRHRIPPIRVLGAPPLNGTMDDIFALEDAPARFVETLKAAQSIDRKVLYFVNFDPIALDGMPIPDRYLIKSPDPTSWPTFMIVRANVDLDDFIVEID